MNSRYFHLTSYTTISISSEDNIRNFESDLWGSCLRVCFRYFVQNNQLVRVRDNVRNITRGTRETVRNDLFSAVEGRR